MILPLLAAFLSASLGSTLQAVVVQQAASQTASAAPAPGDTPAAPPGMVLIPAGRCVVGTEAAQVETLGDAAPSQMVQVLAETPRHGVAVDAFFLDRTEVTNLQWKLFLDATGRKPSTALARYGWPGGAIAAGEEQLPVTNVSVSEIQEYLAWCGKRLPTEPEWTRAARGDDARMWPWGNDWDNRKCLSGLSVSVKPRPVGSYPAGASPYGVLDMAGNVSEWVDSPFTAFDGFQSLVFGKGRGASRLTPDFGADLLVIKGGGFLAVKRQTRIDTRFGLPPGNSDAALGFRAARSTTEGLDSLRHALRRLRPPRLIKPGQFDDRDIFGREVTAFDEARHVITGHRCLAFAHGAEPVPPLSRVRRDARDDPLTLGILVSTEPLTMESMKRDGQPVVLPGGQYTLAFKAAGESRAHRDQQRAASAAGSRPDASGPPARAAALDVGASSTVNRDGQPVSIDDIREDIEFDQTVDAILFLNARNVVVGWSKAIDPTESEPAPIAATSSEGGKAWRVVFALRQAGGKRADRFALELKLAGDGLQ